MSMDQTALTLRDRRARPIISAVQSDRSGDGTAYEGQVPVDDAELVERARRGDKVAFGRLYELHYAKVYRLAQFTLGAGAEDAVAETFLRAWNALPRYRPSGAPFVTWLYGIARHVVVDEVRRSKRTIPTEQVPDGQHLDHPEDGLELRRALSTLPSEQRKLIEMKYLLGLTNPEVAAALGKSVGAVNAQQWRALRALEKVMGR